MKKIYSKFTKARNKEYQIVTDIIEEDGKRYVVKNPLTEESKTHIRKMYDNYVNSSENEEITLCKSKLENDSIIFEFISGESYTTLLINCIEKKNKLGFIELLINYKKLVNLMAGHNNELFVYSKEFETVFGKTEGFTEGVSSSCLNIDMTFDNVIVLESGKNIIIDYEWIMNFSIPINFVIYRAIHGLCVKYSQLMKDIFAEEELLEIMGISQEDASEYRKMENKFIQYVYGTEKSYDKILKNYEKEKYDVQALFAENIFLSQVFIDEGNGYSEEKSYNFEKQEYMEKHNIQIDLTKFKKILSIRFDPLNTSGIVKINKAYVTYRNGESKELVKFSNNSFSKAGTVFVFDTEDSNIIYDVSEENDLSEVNIEYEILSNKKEKSNKELIQAFAKKQAEISALQTDKVNLQNEIARLMNVKDIILDNKHCLEERLSNVINEFAIYKLNK